jgi:hypothetical protein
MTRDDRSNARLLLEAYELIKIVENHYADIQESINGGPLQDAKTPEELMRANDRSSRIDIDHLNILERITTPLVAAIVIELNDGNHISVGEGDGFVTYALQEEEKIWQEDVATSRKRNEDYAERYAKRLFKHV